MIKRILAVLSLMVVFTAGDRLSVSASSGARPSSSPAGGVGVAGPQKPRPALQKDDPRTPRRLPDRTANRLRKAALGPRTTWVRTYQRPGTLTRSGVGVIYGYRMAPAADGGFFLLGHTSVAIPASYDSCVLKIGPDGAIEWQRTLREGAGAGDTQFLRSIAATPDGGCLAGGPGTVAVKFEADGDIAWRKAFTREGTREGFADLVPAAAGGSLLLATSIIQSTPGEASDTDILLIKLDESGEPVWEKTYGGPYADAASRLAVLPGGDIAVCGRTPARPDGSGPSLLLMRLTPTGEILSQTLAVDWGPAVYPFAATPDGGLVAGGYLDEGGPLNRSDAWALKLDPGGAVEWAKSYHGAYTDGFKSLVPAPDGGYFAAGETDGFSSLGEHGLMAELAVGGDIEWQRAYGSENGSAGYVYGTTVVRAPEGALYLAGTASMGGMGGIRFLFMKTSAAGLVERLPGFVTDAALVAQPLSLEIQPALLTVHEAGVQASSFDVTSLDVDIRGGILFAPPLNAAVVRTPSRSLALRGLSNLVTWEANPANDDIEIAKYRIYAVGPIPPLNGDLIILPDDALHLYEVDGDVFRFGQSPLEAGGYDYVIWGVGADGAEGLPARAATMDGGQRP